MNKYFIALIVSILLLFLGYNFWKTTPQYSINKVAESIQNNDIYLFEKHFDVERVAENMSDEMVTYILNRGNLKNELNIIETFASSLIELMKPLFSQQISKQIRGLIEENNDNDLITNDSLSLSLFNSSEFNLINQDKISISIAMLFSGKKIKFSRDGSTTTLKILLNQINENAFVEVILKKYENYWKITEIKNLATFVLEKEESLIKQ